MVDEKIVTIYFSYNIPNYTTKNDKWVDDFYELGAKDIYNIYYDKAVRLLTLELNINPFKLKNKFFIDK